jgi:hypothetical protein
MLKHSLSLLNPPELKKLQRGFFLACLPAAILALAVLSPTTFAVNEGDANSKVSQPAIAAALPVVVAMPFVAKRIPNNAITPNYTHEMIESDRGLAKIFGDPGAIAAANGFEPVALARQYPLYRGDIVANDGRVLRGHLSFAMHLYGSIDGTGNSALYVPAGFSSHSEVPTPTDAAITFYYPRLGNLTNVTLAVFHVANFGIRNDGGRVRIGNIGGPGGSAALYKHAHIEFYRGNTGLPPAALREGLRIDPVTVFGAKPQLEARTTVRSRR